MRTRVLYLGLPLGALCLQRDGLRIVGACISRPDQPGMRRLRARLADEGAPLWERPDLADPAIVEALRGLAPDQIVSWFWTRRIPPEVLALAPFAFNVHPSLLPRHRGPDPYFWALARRDRTTGVTAHRLSEDYDTGPILAQRELAIPDRADAWRLARLLDRPSLGLLRQIAIEHAGGVDHPAVPQDEARATEAPEPSADDCEIRWSATSDEIVALVRAAAPWPGAFTDVFGETLVVLEAEPASSPLELRPGEGVRTRDGVLVGTGDGALIVRAARRDDDDRVARGAAVDELFAPLPRLGSTERG